MIEKILIFVVFLFPIIFFHELGHYLFARFFGVKVEVFSLGFGPKIFKFMRNGTEYALSLIPLGGYIKMFGDDPLKQDKITEADKKFAFNYKGKWARFWIVLGGPLANFIFAFFVFLFLCLVGEKVPAPILFHVEENSLLYEAGFRPGDLLKEINNEKILSAMDVGLLNPEEIIKTVGIIRGKEQTSLSLTMPAKKFVKEFFEISLRIRRPVFRNSEGKFFYLFPGEKDSLAEKLKNYHEVGLEKIVQDLSLSSLLLVPIKNFEAGMDFKKMVLEIENARPIGGVGTLGSRGFLQKLEDMGFYPLDIVVGSISMGSPADKAGLRGGDVIIQIGGAALLGFEDLRKRVAELGEQGQPVTVTYLRNGERKTLQLVPEKKDVNGEISYLLGIFSMGDFLPVEYHQTAARSWTESISLAWYRTWDGMVKVVEGFKRLIFQEASLKNVGGVISIGKVAADSYEIGPSYFFQLMALISINLGVINLFPIPVLDGGHIFFIFLELINKGPLSRKKLEIVQQLGVTVLFLLIFAALFNDINRFF